jgi:DNA-binding MarR family transcriptional regulator
MQSSLGRAQTRLLDEIAEALPQRASALSRLFLAHTTVEISRTEAGVLAALWARPRRVTELAAAEGLSQPAITRLVDRLQGRGWVSREIDPHDKRVVTVRLTKVGCQIFETLRNEYRALVHEEMATLPDADVEALARAIDVLDTLIDRLQDRHPGPTGRAP